MLLYTHKRLLDHRGQPGHPDCPERLQAILAHLESNGLLQACTLRDPAAATATLL